MELLDKINWPEPGKYVLAVSGGVDSMVLLDLLHQSDRGYELVVAYVDHGWRDTTKDWRVVQGYAKANGLDVRKLKLNLKGKSEDEARKGRYEALRELVVEVGAVAVVTAHHQDDLVETVLLNVLRGTGRRGLSPFMSRPEIVRPLLGISKAEIIKNAQDHGLAWAEDSTNVDTRYRRNWVRRELLPRLRKDNPQLDHSLGSYIEEAADLNKNVNGLLMPLLHTKDGSDGKRVSIRSELVRGLPVGVLQELLVQMIYHIQPEAEPDARAVEQLAIDLKCERLQAERALGGRLFASRTRGTVAIAFKAR